MSVVIPASAGIQHPSRHSVAKTEPSEVNPNIKDTGFQIKSGMTGQQDTRFGSIVVRGWFKSSVE